MKKWTKCVALLGMLAICLSMLAGCQVGRNYSEEMMGNKGGLPNFYKDQEVEVPYTGGKPVDIIPTDDPVLAGLCDSEGNLADGSGKVDLSNLGGSSNNSGNSGNSGNNGGGTTVPDDDSQGGSEEPAPDNNGGSSDEDSDDPYAAMIADESGTKVRLMSQNVRYNNAEDALDITGKAAATRIYRLQKLVEKNDPDVIATQECDSFWIDNLPVVFGDTYSMSYRYREATKGSDEACAILYKTAKYDLTDSGTFWLSENPDKADPPGFGQYYPRIAHWVELKDKETGDKILVFSTHFGFGYTVEQFNYLRGLFTDVCAKHPDAYPFVMGDFNIAYGSDHHLAFNNGVNFFDLRDIARDMKADGHCEMGDIRKGTSGAFNSDDGSSIIDFIFAEPRKNQAVDYYTFLYDRIAVEEKNIPQGPVSDHFGVLADVRINTGVSYTDYYGDNAK